MMNSVIYQILPEDDQIMSVTIPSGRMSPREARAIAGKLVKMATANEKTNDYVFAYNDEDEFYISKKERINEIAD